MKTKHIIIILIVGILAEVIGHFVVEYIKKKKAEK